MAIRAVVLDIGGVLEYTPDTGWAQRWSERIGTDVEAVLESAWAGGSVGAIDLPTAERRIGEQLGLGPNDVRAFMDDMWACYVGTPNDELMRWFAALRPAYRTGILSNSFVGAREREQALYGFQDMCDVVVYSHEEGCVKPDPRCYAIVCERLGVAAEQAVFLDDVAANVDGARAAGMRAVRFEANDQAIAELEALLGRDGEHPGSTG